MGARRLGTQGQKGGERREGGPKIRALFRLLHHIFTVSLSLGVFPWNCCRGTQGRGQPTGAFGLLWSFLCDPGCPQASTCCVTLGRMRVEWDRSPQLLLHALQHQRHFPCRTSSTGGSDVTLSVSDSASHLAGPSTTPKH